MIYEYRASVTNVVDGDTIDVDVDVGFNITRNIRLRLARVDTNEVYGVKKESEEYQKGKEQSEFVKNWINERDDSEWPFIIRTIKQGKYGRYITDIEGPDGDVLNDVLLEEFDGIKN